MNGVKVWFKKIPREVVEKDMQFRGAISDFHPIKAALQGADYDPLMLVINEDDYFKDGNNVMIAVKKAAVDVSTRGLGPNPARFGAGDSVSPATSVSPSRCPALVPELQVWESIESIKAHKERMIELRARAKRIAKRQPK